MPPSGTALPPWTLTGWGLIAVYAPTPAAPPGALMLLRYATSPVGPYDELLWAALARTPLGWRPQVRAIWVSGEASMFWGRRTWGLPKRLARFEWAGEARRGEVQVTGEGGRAVAHLAFRLGGPRLPVTAALVPAALRTLAQPPLAGQEGWRLTRLEAGGHVSPAHLTVWHAHGLPTAPARSHLTLGVPEFRLVFPPPERA